MLLGEATQEAGIQMDNWVGFTREIVRSYGAAFVNEFLSTLLSDHLPKLTRECPSIDTGA